MSQPTAYKIRTELSRKDQDALLNFLDSPSGKKILSWMRENMTTGIQTVKDSDYAFLTGMVNGYTSYDEQLRLLPFMDLKLVNPDKTQPEDPGEESLAMMRTKRPTE